MSSKAFGTKTPLAPHIGGSTTKEVGDLRADVEEAMVSLESKSGYPQLGKVTGGAAVSLGAVPVAKAIAGFNFLQDQAKASLVKGTGTSALTFTANRPGEPGNSIQVEILTGGAESVAVVGSKISITLNTGTSTANSVKATVDADAAAAALVQVASGGAGVVAVSAVENLAGGTGLGLEVKINGLEQVVAGAVTETAIPMKVSDLTGAVAGDSVALLVVSNGRQSNSMTVDVVA